MNNSDIDLETLEQWTRHELVTWIEMLDLRPGLRNPGRSLWRLAGIHSQPVYCRLGIGTKN